MMNAKTPEVAKWLWCPMVRTVGGYEDGTRNRIDGAPFPGSMCLADGCAMWRWSNKEKGACGLATPHA